MSFFMCLLCVLPAIVSNALVIKPGPVYDFIDICAKSPVAHLLAVLTRVVVGLALLLCTSSAKFPIAFQVIGWASLAILFASFLLYGVV
jgi:hypothetical protein